MKVNKDTYCVMAHRGLYIQPDKEVKPCCIFGSFDKPLFYDESKSFDEIYNSEQFVNLRKQLANGEKPKSCSDCWEGRSSHREGMNKLFSSPDFKFVPSLHEHEVYYLDLRISNLCNFKCRMCNPVYSSSWEDEVKNYNKDYFPSNRFTQRYIKNKNWLTPLKNNLNKLSTVYLGGGEPIIMKETYELLDLIKKSGRSSLVNLFINTNLSTLKHKNNHIVDVVKDFRTCEWFISCDGLNEVGEYQRTGFKTDIFFKNLDELVFKIKGDNKLTYKIIYAISNINVFDIFNTYETITNRYNNKEIIFDFQIVDTPWNLSIRHTSNKFKQKIIKFIKDNRNRITGKQSQLRLDALLKFISKPSSLPTDSYSINRLKLIKDVDQHRNENLFEVAPWLKEEYRIWESFYLKDKNLV